MALTHINHIPEELNRSRFMLILHRKGVLPAIVMFLACLLQGGMEQSSVEAALNEVLTVEAYPSQNGSGQNNDLTLPASDGVNDGEGLEKTVLREKLFQHNSQADVLQPENATRLQLKSPGKLPGIELGVEMHSLQAFQSVVPSENLPRGWDFKQEQPLLLPPSLNAPDYNGGFLRFTW
jgi:hypothetical protein